VDVAPDGGLCVTVTNDTTSVLEVGPTRFQVRGDDAPPLPVFVQVAGFTAGAAPSPADVPHSLGPGHHVAYHLAPAEMNRLRAVVAALPVDRYWAEVAVAGRESVRAEGVDIRKCLIRGRR
jgi:hypothetical protein